MILEKLKEIENIKNREEQIQEFIEFINHNFSVEATADESIMSKYIRKSNILSELLLSKLEEDDTYVCESEIEIEPEKQIKNPDNVTFGKFKNLKEIINLKNQMKIIYNSNLDEEIKFAILSRFEDNCVDDYDSVEEFIEDIVEDNYIVCDLNACFDAYKNITNTEPFNENGKEKNDVGYIIEKHFKENLSDFHYFIRTEDDVILFKY